ncbi:T9SS type A sorting domain-containing protein [Nonlabens ponticola]|uniref:T9SS type A sorting domain-containing protein n=1 Tax=Nonlabens ponticola TaxID=2496866 RepID=A0A3S9N0M1_9FLAO|nr:T9SS type A sorting domain-containing protein [Nonlabens ponticola]AZQ44939.1 T9SS type A sorting domain-containing protein [Nonlabens ponticola]
MRIFTIALLLSSFIGTSQDLTMMQGGALSISENASLFINGFEITPSTNYELSDSNSFTVFNTSIEEPISVGRVFQMESPLSAYQGNVRLYYQNIELNNLDETKLAMIVQDEQATWNMVESNLDETLKIVEFDFQEPTNFQGITAINRQTLTIDESLMSSIRIFPNPTAGIIQVATNRAVKLEVMNLIGQTVLVSQDASIDLSDLATATYLVKITDVSSGANVFKKIVKK